MKKIVILVSTLSLITLVSSAHAQSNEGNACAQPLPVMPGEPAACPGHCTTDDTSCVPPQSPDGIVVDERYGDGSGSGLLEWLLDHAEGEHALEGPR